MHNKCIFSKETKKDDENKKQKFIEIEYTQFR